MPKMTESDIATRMGDTALILGATMRLTRLVVSDDIGQWFVKEPLVRLEARHGETEHWHDESCPQQCDAKRPWVKYLDGLDCPYCVGFWIGAATLASYHLAKRMGWLGLWRYGAGAFTLNEVAAHLNVLVGDI